MDCLKIRWTKNASHLQNLRNSGAVTPWRSLVKHGTSIVDYWGGFGFFFFTDEKIDLQFRGECQEVAEFVSAAAIKLFPAVAVVTT